MKLRIWVLLLAVAACASAEVRLPALIADRMVVQRGLPVHVWGWADPGEEVAVSFRGTTVETTANGAGDWSVYLPPSEAGGPYTMTVAGENRIQLSDILVGEVWVASGQSNMAWTVGRSNDAEHELAASAYPRIRLFKVALKTADEPRRDVEGAWAHSGPEAVKDFSAVGYFFARRLHEKTDLPIGIIQSAWGGTPAEAWTTQESLDADPALKVFGEKWARIVAAYPRAKARHERALAEWKKAAAKAKAAGNEPPRRPRAPVGPGHQHQPATLYNAMIAPLTPYGVRGAIWYQGENNAGRAEGYEYRRLFPTMIEDWRRKWSVGAFPFLFVQLANYAKVSESSQWPELREAQALTLGLRATAMAVTIDIGNPEDIHPRNKQDVGLRLALAARAIVYGETDLVYSGPAYRQMTREGGKVRLWFDSVGGGLRAKGGSLKGFEIAGADRSFHPAEARIDSETVVVGSAEVRDPVAVRYAWADAPPATLFNAEDLPASPFRTDQWRE